MEVNGQLHCSDALTTGKDPTVPLDGWAPKPVWTRWRRENFPGSAVNVTPAVQPTA